MLVNEKHNSLHSVGRYLGDSSTVQTARMHPNPDCKPCTALLEQVSSHD